MGSGTAKVLRPVRSENFKAISISSSSLGFIDLAMALRI